MITLPFSGTNRSGACVLQNLRRGHYELATDARAHLRLATAFTELALAV